ncbi:MAG: cell division protein ZapA [Candidatus Cloacimonetes bacterium]|nr:cell division protein ZapA [Candidatus Cloacimonadota bacterium]MBS3767231.1 cell division protein ZapA [Candidatus Cloacimonadota bacterium]
METISVNIFGDKYSISGDTDKKKILKYAHYLDTKLSDLSNKSSIESKYKLAVLCSLNIIEELFNEKKQKEKIEKKLKSISSSLDSILEEEQESNLNLL